MKKLYISYILLLASVLSVSAEQDSMERNVTVERDYNPTAIDAKKISPVPTKEDLNVDQPEVTYSTWSRAEDVNIKNDAAKANSFSDTRTDDSKKGVAKLGLGFYWQTLAEFYYPLLHGDDYLFDINLKHLGNFSHNYIGYKDDPTPVGYDPNPRAMEHNTSLNLNFEKQLRDVKLLTGAYVSYNGFDYYGVSALPKALNPLQNAYGSYTTAGAHIGLESTNPHAETKYELDLGYNYFGTNHGVGEHNILLEGEVAGEVGPGEMGLEFEVNANIMTQDTVHHEFEEHFPSGAFIKLTPFYAFGGRRYNVKIGGNLFIMAEKGTPRPVTGSADIKATFALVPEQLYLNAGIGGFFDENMYSHIMKENKWVNPELFVEPTYSPIDINVNLKANLMKGLVFDAGVRYTYILDQYYFVNDVKDGLFKNTFHAVYDNTHKLTAQLGLYFNYVKGLDITVKGKYNYWGVTEQECAWQKPSWEVNFDAKYTIKEKWCVGLSYNFLGGRYALVHGVKQHMKNVHDLNVSLSYQVFDWFQVFAEGRNLINCKADTYYGYTTMGINALAGVTFRF